MKVAALYVQAGGCYFGLPDVDPWDERRDARTYAGPWPVVAHPPCARWGKYATGGPGAFAWLPGLAPTLGDDGGCFAAALASVRRWGGVIEHPAASAAWATFGLPKPAASGGWSAPDEHGGRSCHVEQAHFGHRARKATWLYSVGADLPELPWGPAPGDFLPPSRSTRAGMVSQMSKRDRAATPHAFRDLLVRVARGCTNSRSTGSITPDPSQTSMLSPLTKTTTAFHEAPSPCSHPETPGGSCTLTC